MPPLAVSPPQPPDLPPELELSQITVLAHDASYADVELSGAALSNQRANGVTLDTARLVNVELFGSRLAHLRLTDCVLRACDLANTEAQRAGVTRVMIETSRLTGIHLNEAALRDVTVRGCRVDLASFGFSRLSRVSFEHCILAQTDFLEAQLESVRFLDCDLSGADFRGARMQRCEFRRTDLSGLQGVENLRGSAMEWSDIVEMAGIWAAALGIEVLDPD